MSEDNSKKDAVKNENGSGKDTIKKVGAEKGAAVGGAVAGAVTGAAASAVAAAAAGTTTSLTVGAGFAPFVSALGAAKLASLPGIVLFLANPVGGAIATGALAVGGAVVGYKIAKAIAKKL
ncbi:hypothetical protein [Nitrosomonas sp. Nm58]|uniref:hypothetical protein n=1 Tax=Nitrosomonas sp. Nm58 TaxID=200126 RepID=UPI00089C12D0|nr:hypothetical protein [Nitrosomonas sp. Nm58]SDY39140.1 hypothetical protein SAMN05421754_100871 [Nitrosomonas sp. Nm58]